MNFEEKLEEGRRLVKRGEAPLQIRSLMQDPRFAALLGWLEQRGWQYVEAGSAQKMAEHHGCLAHCQGSVHAFFQILSELRHLHDNEPGKAAKTQRRD